MEYIILATMALVLCAAAANGAHSVSRRTLWSTPMAMYPATSVGVQNGSAVLPSAPISIQAARSRRIIESTGPSFGAHESTIAA